MLVCITVLGVGVTQAVQSHACVPPIITVDFCRNVTPAEGFQPWTLQGALGESGFHVECINLTSTFASWSENDL